MRPNVRGSEKGMSSSSTISTRLVHWVGFSKGCAELALKNPPPLVPSSLIASCEATGPPGSVCVPPARVVRAWNGSKFWMTPPMSRTIAATTAIGSRMRNVPRTRSTQKFPIVRLWRYAKPRTRAIATAMPTAAETKFCTTRPASCTV